MLPSRWAAQAPLPDETRHRGRDVAPRPAAYPRQIPPCPTATTAPSTRARPIIRATGRSVMSIALRGEAGSKEVTLGKRGGLRPLARTVTERLRAPCGPQDARGCVLRGPTGSLCHGGDSACRLRGLAFHRVGHLLGELRLASSVACVETLPRFGLPPSARAAIRSRWR